MADSYVRAEQEIVERFVRCEYWRLAAQKDGRFAHTRAPIVEEPRPWWMHWGCPGHMRPERNPDG